jgi:hypothetical protein
MAAPDKQLRWNIFRELFPYYGKLVTPHFYQKDISCIPVFKKVHFFIEYLYTIAWSSYIKRILFENACADY